VILTDHPFFCFVFLAGKFDLWLSIGKLPVMLSSRRSFSSAGPSSRSGLTRIELLVLLGILVILAGAGFGPISKYLEKAKINRAVESARTINTLLSQYATDNNGVYPVGEGTSAAGKSEGIARNLLENKYTPDATVFAVGSTARYRGTTPDFSDIGAANISWDFTGGVTTTTGITSAAPDLLPTVYGTGENVAYPPTAETGLNLTLSGQGPFAKSGIVVAYKSNNATFIRGTPSGTTVECQGFISTAFKDTASYTQIKP
jgi:type II secretory pathway pseudopilin PulG